MRDKCRKCGRGFKVLTNQLCYFCHINKFKEPPTTGAYEQGKKK